jgi:hypothetical protein
MNTTTRRAMSAVSLAMLAGFGLTACEKSLDTPKLEAAIKSYSVDTFPGLDVKGVVCPKRPIKEADTFDCEVTVEDATASFKVTQKDTKGNVHFVVTTALLDRAKLETLIAKDLETSDGSKISVSCGSTKVVSKVPADTFDCALASPTLDHDMTVVVTVKDVNGAVSWKVA